MTASSGVPPSRERLEEYCSVCGITGMFDTAGRREIDRTLLERMTTSIAHRGPDGHGFHVEPGVGLGHRRLSIIDLAGGKQPIYNDCLLHISEPTRLLSISYAV